VIAAIPNHLRIPADRCFWSLVDAPGVRVTGPLPEALRDELADDLPVDVSELFAVTAPVSSDRLLVCAVRRAYLADIPDSALTLRPDSVPSEFGVSASPEAFNFLVGEYEPGTLKRARLRRHATLAGVVVLSAALVAIGLVRRAHREHVLADTAAQAADTIARELAPGQGPATALLALDQELTMLRRRTQATGVLAPPQDASVHLAGLLNGWPSSVSSKPQSLSVSPSAIAASVSIETKDTADFLKAMRAPTGWTLDEPRMNTASGLTRVSLTLKPSSPRATASAAEHHP